MSNPKAQVAVQTLLDLHASRPVKLVIEIGCIRYRDEMPSEGFSTPHLAKACRDIGASFRSYDIDAKAVETANQVLHARGLDAVVVHKDGLIALQDVRWAIDYLYLDGGGLPEVHLAQVQEALLHMKDDGVIVVDDVHPNNGQPQGKGTLLIPWWEDQGWSVDIVPTYNEYKTAILTR